MGVPAPLGEAVSAVVRMLATVTGRPMGDGIAPTGAVEADGYGVVTVIPGGYYLADMAMPGADMTVVVQTTAVGLTRVRAQWLSDRCRSALLSRVAGTGAFTNAIDAFTYNSGGAVHSLAADVGMAVWRRELDMDGGIISEGPLHNAVVRYELTVGTAS